MRTPVIIAVGTVVVALAASAVAWWLFSSPATEEVATSERVTEARTAFADGSVWVSSEREGWLSDEQLQTMESAIGDAQVPVRVIVGDESREGGFTTDRDLVAQVESEAPGPYYYIRASPRTLTTEESLVRHWGSSGSRFDETTEYDDQSLTADEVTDRVVEFIEENGPDTFDPVERQSYAFWGGVGGMIAAIVLLGLLAGAVLASVTALVWYRARARRNA